MELWFHHWFHQDQDWWGLHQTNNQTWFNIKTSQCQYKVSATRLKISVLRKCGILEQTIANIWIIFDQTIILVRTFDWRPSCIYTSWSLSWWRKVARLWSDVKRKKTIKLNNKNLFRIFTCRNLDVYLENFGCLWKWALLEIGLDLRSERFLCKMRKMRSDRLKALRWCNIKLIKTVPRMVNNKKFKNHALPPILLVMEQVKPFKGGPCVSVISGEW